MKKILLILSVSVFISCNHSPKGEADAGLRDKSITSRNAFVNLFFDSLTLENFIRKEGLDDSSALDLRRFYNGRNYQFAWFDSAGVAPYASTFLAMQNDYMGYAKDSSSFDALLQAMIDSLNNRKPSMNDSLISNAELLLTNQFFRYADKAYRGNSKINAKELDWFIPRKKIDLVETLDSMIVHRTNGSEYEPVNRQYKLLKEYLLKYYSIEKEGGWKTIRADKNTYEEGDESPVLAEIKERLLLTGDMTSRDSSGKFDAALTEAVKNYQERYGFSATGKINKSLLNEMNRPVNDRIRQILINMERIRWAPAEPTGDYLLVNIPEYTLHAYSNGELVWNMNVVVGSAANSTVIFSGNLTYVVFSPYWNVPPGILNKEVLPGIKKNPNYLAKHNMEMVNGAVRQKPGKSNSLGLVKFLFPNSYNIYLHDTPAKSLFNEDRRDFSHGCIRLGEPKKLAEWLLRNDSSWTDAAIAHAMNAGKEKFLTLKKPVPVFIGYFTTWVDRKGRLNFRDDIYKHDTNLAKKMFNESSSGQLASKSKVKSQKSKV